MEPVRIIGCERRTSRAGAQRSSEQRRSFLCERRRRRRIPSARREQLKIRGHLLAAAAAFLGCLLTGCSVGYPNDGSSAAPTASSMPSPSIPSDGITLAGLGYLNGPIHEFSLPRTAVITAKVDQPNNVVAVVSLPSPAELRSYLLRALPAAGFEITADRPATSTLTFAGHGWSGSFTGDDRASAVLLRPR